MRVLVDAIAPAVKRAQAQSGDLLNNAIRANVDQSVELLKRSEPILGKRVAAGSLEIVGGVYHLGSGKITLTQQ